MLALNLRCSLRSF